MSGPTFYPFSVLPNSPTQTCCLCLNDISDGEDVVELPCGAGANLGSKHIYHWSPNSDANTCTLENWFKNHEDCPICRTGVDVLDLRARGIVQLQPDSDLDFNCECGEEFAVALAAIALAIVLVALAIFLEDLNDPYPYYVN